MAVIERLEEMLEQGRDDAMLRFGLGSALFNEGRFEEATVHLSRCIEQDENYSAAYKLLGKALFRLARFDDAAQVLETGLPVAVARGDRQSEKEIRVFLGKVERNR